MIEYITQLETEVQSKTNEAAELKRRNAELMAENARSRNFINLLLRHQAFQPFLEDLSRDPTLSDTLPNMNNAAPSSQTQQAPTAATTRPKDINPFQASQTLNQSQEGPIVGMATVPDQSLDISALNINGNPPGDWSLHIGYGFQVPNVYSVLDLPAGPAEPLNTETLAGKGTGSMLDHFTAEEDDSKTEHPVIERPVVETVPSAAVEDESDIAADPAFSLYLNVSTSTPVSSPVAPLTSEKSPEFELVVRKSSEEDLTARLERMCAAIDPVCGRIEAWISSMM